MAIYTKDSVLTGVDFVSGVEGKIKIQGLDPTDDNKVIQEAVITSDDIQGPFQDGANISYEIEGGAKLFTCADAQYRNWSRYALGDVATSGAGHSIDYKGAPAAQHINDPDVSTSPGYVLTWGTGTATFTKGVGSATETFDIPVFAAGTAGRTETLVVRLTQRAEGSVTIANPSTTEFTSVTAALAENSTEAIITFTITGGGATTAVAGHTLSYMPAIDVKVPLNEINYPVLVQDDVTYTLDDNSFLAGFAGYTDSASGVEYAPNTLFPGEDKTQAAGDPAAAREYFIQSAKGTAQLGVDEDAETLRLNRVSFPFFVNTGVTSVRPNKSSVIFGYQQTTI